MKKLNTNNLANMSATTLYTGEPCGGNVCLPMSSISVGESRLTIIEKEDTEHDLTISTPERWVAAKANQKVDVGNNRIYWGSSGQVEGGLFGLSPGESAYLRMLNKK